MDQKNNEALTFYNRSQDFIEVRMDEARFPRLRDIDTRAAFPQVKAMVVGAAILRGTAMTDAVIDMTAEAFLQEVWQDFPGLTIPEIGKAVRDGCFEKYGQVYGINAVSLYKMVQGYSQSEEAERLQRRAEERKKMTREKTRQWIREHPDAVLGKFAEDFTNTHTNK